MKDGIKSLLAVGLVSMLAGCKLAVMVPSGGDVTSASGTRNCTGGSLCEHNITDSTFNESFTAVARPGYVFKKWNKGAGFFCGDSTNPTCTISNVGTAGNAAIEGIIATGQLFYVMPLFEFVGIDTDGDGQKDHVDEDDDNDGVLDADDQCPLDDSNTCANMNAYSLRLSIKTNRVFANENDEIIGDYAAEGVYADPIAHIHFEESPFRYRLYPAPEFPDRVLHYTYDYGVHYWPAFESSDCSGTMFIVTTDLAARAPDGKVYVADTSRPYVIGRKLNSVWTGKRCLSGDIWFNGASYYARLTDIDLGVSGALSEKYL